MPRFQIDLPEHFPFKTTLPIRIHEVNYGKHLGNDAVLSLVHEARMQFLHHVGFSEFDVGGVGIIMIDAAMQYKAEGFWGDEIEVHVAVGDLTNTGFDLYYKLVNNTRGQDLAYVKTGMLCFDYESRKVRRLPEVFREKFSDSL